MSLINNKEENERLGNLINELDDKITGWMDGYRLDYVEVIYIMEMIKYRIMREVNQID